MKMQELDRRDREERSGAPFQFRLNSLFIAVSVACVAFALIGNYGIDGFTERLCGALAAGSMIYPFFELYKFWRDDVKVFKDD